MLLLRVSSPATAASDDSCGSWNNVPSGNTSIYTNLLGVATISSNDIWAVGHSILNVHSVDQTLTEHWNGTSWSIIPSPNVPSAYFNYLYGVTAISTNNVWAVGTAAVNLEMITLIEHWDGTTWSIVPSPNPKTSQNVLTSVTAVSANDIWAVGYYQGPSNTHPLIEHWNGSQWSIDHTLEYLNVALNSVIALSSDNIWAVGNDFDRSNYSLIVHWNGSKWSGVPAPKPNSNPSDTLSGIAAVSTTDIWVVGSYFSDHSKRSNVLIEHWNGTQWSIVPGAPTTSSYVSLLAVGVISATNIWAVGYSDIPTSNNIYTLTEHWNGTAWSIVASPNPGDYQDSFNAVAEIPGSNYIWAVGYSEFQTADQYKPYNPLTAYYC
ncbi:MAG TPA: hypothetical protein VNG51_19620 [Ktedonobacteraceae bacterium]|nr:hypothetical protein [Ktedonobacteraceae bacterium]